MSNRRIRSEQVANDVYDASRDRWGSYSYKKSAGYKLFCRNNTGGEITGKEYSAILREVFTVMREMCYLKFKRFEMPYVGIVAFVYSMHGKFNTVKYFNEQKEKYEDTYGGLAKDFEDIEHYQLRFEMESVRHNDIKAYEFLVLGTRYDKINKMAYRLRDFGLAKMKDYEVYASQKKKKVKRVKPLDFD